MEKYYSVKEAAKEFSLSEKTLLNWLRAGKLKADKVGRAWRISDSVMRDYLKIPPADDEVDFLIEDEIISTLANFQEKLLTVEASNKSGILRSRVLRVAARLDEIIDYLYDEDDVYEHRWNAEEVEDTDMIRGIGTGGATGRYVTRTNYMGDMINSKNEIKLDDFIDGIVSSLIGNSKINIELLNHAFEIIKATLELAIVGNEEIKRINKISNVFRQLEYDVHNINKTLEATGDNSSINYFQCANFRQLQEVLPAWIKGMNIVRETSDKEKSKG